MPRSRPPLLTAAFVRILAMQTLFGASQACYVLLPKFLSTEFDAGRAGHRGGRGDVQPGGRRPWCRRSAPASTVSGAASSC